MDRVAVYPGAIPLETDILRTNRFAMIGLAKVCAALFGTSTIANGLACTPNSPADLTVKIAPGELYSLQTLDGTAFSSLAADTAHSIVKQGISLDTTTLSCPAPATSGYSVNYLVQATYQDVDSDATVLPFYNAANPTQAYSGPNNSGASSYTTRKGSVVISAKAGVAAATGSQTTPAADTGYTGLYVVTVAYGQTAITAANISIVAGAPFVPNLGIIAGGLQGNACNVATAGGTADAITAAYTPGISALSNGMTLYVRAAYANTTATPTFTPASSSIAAKTIVKGAGVALAAGDIAGAGHWIELQYDSTLDRWVLLNPATGFGVTPPQFDNSTKNATTAFVQRALGNFSAYTMITAAATTLTAAQAGGCFLVNAASAVVTLPNAAQSNLSYTLYAGTTFTLTAQSGSIIGPNSSSTSISVPDHGSIEVISDGGNWEIIGGSAVAPRTVATPAQFDSTNLIATTNFVQRALGNVQGAVGISANTQLTAANAGQLIIVSGNTSTITITLPSVSTISVGASFTFQFLTAYDCIISTGSSMALYGTGITSGTAITIPAYGNAVVTYDGLNFAVRTDSLIGTQATTDNSNRVASTAFVKNNFLASTASPGYQRLASGVIIQWGKSYAPDDSYTAITFPTTFPNGCWVVTATPETTGAVSGGNAIGAFVGSISSSGCSIGQSLYAAAPATGYTYWIAIGN